MYFEYKLVFVGAKVKLLKKHPCQNVCINTATMNETIKE